MKLGAIVCGAGDPQAVMYSKMMAPMISQKKSFTTNMNGVFTLFFICCLLVSVGNVWT